MAPISDHWAMNKLMRALEGTDWSIQVNVEEFVGSLNPEKYCESIASLKGTLWVKKS